MFWAFSSWQGIASKYALTKVLVLAELLKRLLKAFAEVDLFNKPESPTFFLVYAHNNPEAGTANAARVRDLISWLRILRSRVISDRSLSLEPWATREDSDFFRDILSNQFCLLPKRGKATSVSNVSNVDKVILCCSDVLQSYSEDVRMKAYTSAIREFYFRPETDPENTDEVKKGLEKIVQSYCDKEGFHHVITELAFLEIRCLRSERHHGIIPIMLNGDNIKYLPLHSIGVPLWLKPQAHSKSIIHECQVLHRLLFNLLRQLYKDRHTSIYEFEDCYKSCAERLSPGSILPSQEDFGHLIAREIASTMGRLASNHSATVRMC